MSEKKNIDRLFQEKFKDFEAAPPDKVWNNIASELQKNKKRRRVVPLWAKLSGIAAVLVIGLIAIYPFFNGGDFNVNPVVYDKKEKNSDGSTKIKPTQVPIRNNPTVIDAGNNTVTTTEGNQNAEENNSENTININPNTIAPFNTGNTDNAVVTNAEKPGRSNTANSHTPHGNNAQGNRNTVPQSGAVVYSESQNANEADDKAPVVVKEGVDAKINRDRGVAVRNEEEAENNSEFKVKADSDRNLQIINNGNSEDADKAVAEAAENSTETAPENELEKLLQEQLNKTENDVLADAALTNRWNIKPQLAPVFYNSLSQGSPIDAQFSGNTKEYDNNMSYGVGVNYALSKKLSIRSGINTVNLSYATQDIEFYASLNSTTPNVRTASQSANIVVQNQGQASSFAPLGFATDQVPTQVFGGQMVQQMGYVEVPVELSYALVDKKFGIDIIGGVSTLFLNDNNISVVSVQGYSTNIGQADNLNSVNFSTNVGIGFKYRFWKSFQANFEPTFKYQVNTFSTNSGNFRPYFIGLYSGVSFSF